MVVKTYTIHEFLELQRKREVQEIERKLSDRKFFKVAVFTLAIILRGTEALATGDPIPAITPIVMKILYTLQYIGIFVCVFMWIKEVINAISSGDGIKELVSITVKYVFLGIALYVVPEFILGIPKMMGR